MSELPADAADDLRTIRGLMDRARLFRHLPPTVPLLAGCLAIGVAVWSHLMLSEVGVDRAMPRLAWIWGSLFAVCLAFQLALGYRESLRDGSPFWSSLSTQIAHALWPPLLSAMVLTVVLARRGAGDLIPPLWMLCYGIGGVASGTFARPAVRTLGVSFIVAGIATLLFTVPSALALGVTFGGFHVVYGAWLALRPLAP